jgi:uncharacterized protein YbjT (DUF2867 family)
MSPSIVAVAGATGDLGTRIIEGVVSRGGVARALVRENQPVGDRERLAALGAELAPTDLTNVAAVADALDGVDCVVSALSGLREVIVDAQTVLIDAAVRARVPRFIPSDYAADFTRTAVGHNRNFDLRREFLGRADRAPIAVTSILNGGFLDMIGAEMPLVQPRIHRVICWVDADQPLDFTARADVAAYTAAAALDPTTPRLLRIAGATVSAREIADTMTSVTGESYRTLRLGGLRALDRVIGLMQLVAPQPDVVFPAWQGMQYTRDMFSGDAQLLSLDNDRYPGIEWFSLRDQLELRFGPSATASPAGVDQLRPAPTA